MRNSLALHSPVARPDPIAQLNRMRCACCINQAKNNVTSRIRLDEKYAERRAVQKPVNQTSKFARVFVKILQRDNLP
jgi:hypothetical protein